MQNSYAVVVEGRAVLIGAAMPWSSPQLRKLGVKKIDAILVTQPEAEQLRYCGKWPVPVIAPLQARAWMSAQTLEDLQIRPPNSPVYPNYDPPTNCLVGVEYRLAEALEFVWKGLVFSSLATPGHTPAAHSILLRVDSGLLAFCGDAVCGCGRVWKPHFLEWDHWTATGIRAAAHGLWRLAKLAPIAVFPAHGEVNLPVSNALRSTVRNLSAWADLKENILPGVQVGAPPMQPAGKQAWSLLPGLFQFGKNAYLLAANNGEGFVVDIMRGEENILAKLMRRARVRRISLAAATHFHVDHANGLPMMRAEFGARILVPEIASSPLRNPNRWSLPFRCEPLRPDPDFSMKNGQSTFWNEYHIASWDFPGQTRYHGAFSVSVDGRLVLFSGDNFFRPERYNGSGGCSHANHATPEGFAASARLALSINPWLIAAGHRGMFLFSKHYFNSFLRWAARYRAALCNLRHPADTSGYFSHDSY